jgi:hypothetical protein
MNITKFIDNYPTESSIGFTSTEIKEMLENNFPSITAEEFDKKMGTCTVTIEGGKIRHHHTDVELALVCCIEGRDKTVWEWD